MITNRGVKVWPDGFPETFCTDHWRCRFKADGDRQTVGHDQFISLLGRVAAEGLDFIKTENLCLELLSANRVVLTLDPACQKLIDAGADRYL